MHTTHVLRTRMFELYGLREGFIHFKGTSWPLFPDSTRAAAVKIRVVHRLLYVLAFLSGEINLIARWSKAYDRKREVLIT